MAKLVELLEKIIGGGTPSKNENKYWNGNIPWASVKDIGENQVYLSYTQDSITKEGLAKSSSNLIPKGNVIIPTRMGLGRCVINKIDTAINQDLKALIPKKDKLNNKYLLYWLKFNAALIESMGSGTTVKGIRLEQLTELELNDIDIKIQQKIARILSNYDDLIENNNRRIKILEEMAQKIYKEWFVDFKFPGHETTTFKDSPLGKIPNDWEVDFVKNILIRLKSKHKYTQNNILKEGKIIVIDQSTSEYLGFHNDKPDFKANPQKPLIIFGDHTCKMQMLVEDFSIGPNVIPISSEKVPITFLYYLIDSLIETKEYKRHWNDLISKKVVLPINSLSESFSNIITPLMTMINHLKHKNMKLKQTRDILLPRLISGEIDVENMEVL